MKTPELSYVRRGRYFAIYRGNRIIVERAGRQWAVTVEGRTLPPHYLTRREAYFAAVEWIDGDLYRP